MQYGTVTFGQLKTKLRELGFKQYRVGNEEQQGWMFERTKAPATQLWLIDHKDGDELIDIEINQVLILLRREVLEQKVLEADIVERLPPIAGGSFFLLKIFRGEAELLQLL